MSFYTRRSMLVVSTLIASIAMTSCGQPTNGLTLVAGQQRIHTDGTRSVAKFALPYSITTAANNVMFVVDVASHTVRRVNTAGAVSTIAGSAYQTGSADGVGSSAQFNRPVAIAADQARNVFYVVDAGNNTIRKVMANGTVTTFAGVAGQSGYADGTGAQARFSFTEMINNEGSAIKLVVDSLGNIFVTDAVGMRKITPQGVVSTYFSSLTEYTDASNISHPVNATYATPNGIDLASNPFVVDSQSNFWFGISDGLQQVTATGLLGVRDTMVGSTSALAIKNDKIFTYYGSNTGSRVTTFDITNQQATLVWQQGQINPALALEDLVGMGSITVDSLGNVYGADPIHAVVRRYGTDGTASVLTGTTPLAGARNGNKLSSSFVAPSFVTTDPSGNLYIAETMPTIRFINAANNNVSTRAGSAAAIGQPSTDGIGANARFTALTGMTFNPSANALYLLDQQSGSTLVRRMTLGGSVTTVALNNTLSSDTYGLLTHPTTGVMFVLDNKVVKSVTRAGVVSTVAGQTASTAIVDGIGTQASFNAPAGLAMNTQGVLYTIDKGALRSITPQGTVTSVAGAADQYGQQDGNFVNARFGQSAAVIGADNSGSVYIKDCGNAVEVAMNFFGQQPQCFLRKVDTANQQVTTTGVNIPHTAGLTHLHFSNNGAAYTNFENGVFQVNLN